MRLGRDTNSVNNWLMSGAKGQPTPEVGMGGTLLMWTDRHAVTVTRVSASGKTLWFKQDKATRTDDNGMSESQRYSYEADPDARERKATLRKNGAWVESRAGTRLRLGDRNEYRDYSF